MFKICFDFKKEVKSKRIKIEVRELEWYRGKEKPFPSPVWDGKGFFIQFRTFLSAVEIIGK
jgi:hypothetical protein